MKKIILGIITAVMGIFMATTPAFAEVKRCYCEGGKEGIQTALLGDENGCYCAEDGRGGGVIHILNLVVNIMTVGVGILGVVGISIVGIQYLTAGGNEERTRKAKRRMIEIVLGIVAYVVIYALLVWLIPDFKPIGA